MFSLPPISVIPILTILCSFALWKVLGKPLFVPNKKLPLNTKHRLSLIIPARDEAHNLPTLLRSIQNQEITPTEVIVVDDNSTDNTAESAHSFEATVVSPESPSSEWIGKSWACQNGADNATGDWLLFLDADTKLETNGLEKIYSLIQKDVAVSVCPYHIVQKPYEQLSSFFNVITTAGIDGFCIPNQQAGSKALFGQALLVAKSDYEKIGGHESVKGEILENFSLAKKLQSNGTKTISYLGKGCLSMRMFPEGLGQLWKSWKKGFTTGAQSTSGATLTWISIWLSAGMTATFSLLFAPLLGGLLTLNLLYLFIIAYLVFATTCWWSFRLVGNFSIWNALFFPISLFFYQILFFTALINQKRGARTKWKGRYVD